MHKSGDSPLPETKVRVFVEKMLEEAGRRVEAIISGEAGRISEEAKGGKNS